MQDYNLIINGLLCAIIILMVVLLVIMTKSLRRLKKSAIENNEKGKVWINKKFYDFNADQLKILIKKINKVKRNDKQVETKN